MTIKYLTNKQFLEAVESNDYIEFRIDEDASSVTLETWTQGGVNMFIHLDKHSTPFQKQYSEYVLNFYIDEVIDTHREDESYRSAFYREDSLKDFNNYLMNLKLIEEDLIAASNGRKSKTDQMIFDEVFEKIENLSDDNYKLFIMSILRIELQETDVEVLEAMYEYYMQNDAMKLIDNDFYRLKTTTENEVVYIPEY